MASLVDSSIETDGADPDQSPAEVEEFTGSALPAVVDVESQQVKRIVADDGSELVVLTAAQYDEMAKRPHVADWLYDQLHDERRQRLDVAEKYRSCSDALARETHLVTRYRQLLIKHQLQLEPTVDGAKDVVGAELPKAFFDEDRSGGEELEDRGLAESTRSVQTTETVAPHETELTQKVPSRLRQSALESDEAVVIPQPVSGDAGRTFPHEQWKSSSGAGKVAASTEDFRGGSRRHRQLLDEASDALRRVTTATSSATSRDLLQKVLEQNARLKQLLRKVVDTQGMTVREFLERSDYAELVEKLQKEIDELRSQVKEQRQQLVADDTKLTATCAALTDKVHRLEHSSAVKQALIEVYSAECARLQSEVKRLSASNDANGGKDSQHQHQLQQQQKEPLVSSDNASTVGIQKISQDFVELRQKYLESERLSRSRMNELESLLSHRTKRLKQLETDNKALENKLRTIMHQIHRAAATKETNAEPKSAAKLSGCGQSRHLDRPWMTSLPQTELTVDCETADEPPPPRASSSSSSSSSCKGERQQQQQLGAEDVKPSEPVIDVDDSTPATPPSAADGGAGDAGGTKDGEDDVDGKTDPDYVCLRCDQEFSDETRYETHCKKCRDD